MDRNIFAAGTIPGSPATQSEIKTLICYLLAGVDRPISFAQLHGSLKSSELVNYFELIDSLSSLVLSHHIDKTVENDVIYYTVLDLGVAAAKTLDNSLPLSVREKAIESLNRKLLQDKRLSEVGAKVIELETGGYKVKLHIPEMILLDVFSPTKQEAEKIRLSFLNDPVFIYQSIQSLLSGDRSVLGELKPSDYKLF